MNWSPSDVRRSRGLLEAVESGAGSPVAASSSEEMGCCCCEFEDYYWLSSLPDVSVSPACAALVRRLDRLPSVPRVAPPELT